MILFVVWLCGCYYSCIQAFIQDFLLGGGNLGRLMRVSIEGPALPAVNFSEVLNIFKQKNRRIQL